MTGLSVHLHEGRGRAQRSTVRRLLIAGGCAAPLLIAGWAAQAFTRPTFRPTFHPMSLLSLGELGWLQIANFVVTGLLVVAGGVGLRTLRPGRLTRWASTLIIVMGIGLVISGVFVTDAGAGFPPGAPAGAPEMSWHGAVHEAGFLLTQLGFLAAAVTLTVRFARSRQRAWAVVCATVPVAAVAVAAVGEPETFAIRLVVSAALQLLLVSVLSLAAWQHRVT